jgi:renalase
MKKRIAIIGAGFSGVILGKFLQEKAEVKIFEKSRGIGGRMSTRYTEDFAFDMGAQCFTARSKIFQDFLQPYIESGIVNEWRGNVINLEVGLQPTKRIWLEKHFVSSPNMNSLCKEIAKGMDISLGTEIIPLSKPTSKGYELLDKSGKNHGCFDLVISTAPPIQTSSLFAGHLPENNIISNSNMHGCHVLMLGFNEAWQKDWIAAKVHNNPIKWISINSGKPGRNNQATSIVIHTRHNWSKKHMEDDMPLVEQALINEFEKLTNIDTSKAAYVSSHRWRYAVVSNSLKCGPYYDSKNGLAAISDWSATSRIEELYLSAAKLLPILEENLFS